MKRYIRSATTSKGFDAAHFIKDPKELAQLANDEDEDVRAGVAENSNTPAGVLAQLANDEDAFVKRHVGSNPSTPAEVLAQLANDADKYVRRCVAGNPSTSVAVIAQLANEKDTYVRYNAARNSNTPPDILAQLASDEDKEVRRAAKDNPNCQIKSKKWPSADEWYNIDSDEAFENMWSRYLAGPEDEINKKLQIFTEPSVQGGMGGMFIFDESGENHESFSVDFQYWCDQELSMAADSKSAKGYKQKYEAFVEALISENWR